MQTVEGSREKNRQLEPLAHCAMSKGATKTELLVPETAPTSPAMPRWMRTSPTKRPESCNGKRVLPWQGLSCQDEDDEDEDDEFARGELY